MGIFDKLKDVTNLVTGGSARVTLEYEPRVAYPGEDIEVRVVVTSTGGQVKSKGIFVDIKSSERLEVPRHTVTGQEGPVNTTYTGFSQELQIAPAFVLEANETREFSGHVRLPTDAQPTFQGRYVRHQWSLRGRMEALGNDPDSGFLELRVASNG